MEVLMFDSLINEEVLNNKPHYERKIRENWEYLIETGKFPKNQRTTITSSWKRCLQYGLDPLSHSVPLHNESISCQEREEENHLLTDIAIPLTAQIIKSRSNEELVLGLINAEGNLIHLSASHSIKNQIPLGSNWLEENQGTNAAGTALFEQKPLQIFAEEHFCRNLHHLFTSAAPIRDPFTREVIGVLTLAKEKNTMGVQDLFSTVTIGHKIERQISDTLIKHNNFALQSLFNNSKAPFTVFNNAGRITFFNQAAQQAFLLKIGDAFSTFIEGNPFVTQTDNLFTKYGVEWKIRVQPYKIGANLYGGIAVFDQVNRRDAPSKRKREGTRYQFSSIITEHQDMHKVISLAKKAALYEKPVLLTGETGTGKEMFAQSIHAHGTRQGAFVEINCGAVTRELAASEMFGYTGGAFTGSNPKGNPGKFTLAHQGTIFLDEIGDLPLEAQAFLLRILEERTVVPVGGSKPVPVDIQVIAATNKNLLQEVNAGNFREDLYYRLNVIHLRIPPVRQRRGDIQILVKHFLNQQRGHAKPLTISEEVKDFFDAFPWPGNVRQLKNTIEHAAFYAEGTEITINDLPEDMFAEEGGAGDSYTRNKTVKNQFTHQELIRALQNNEGNITKTAQFLDVSRVTIYRKLKEINEMKLNQ